MIGFAGPAAAVIFAKAAVLDRAGAAVATLGFATGAGDLAAISFATLVANVVGFDFTTGAGDLAKVAGFVAGATILVIVA